MPLRFPPRQFVVTVVGVDAQSASKAALKECPFAPARVLSCQRTSDTTVGGKHRYRVTCERIA